MEAGPQRLRDPAGSINALTAPGDQVLGSGARRLQTGSSGNVLNTLPFYWIKPPAGLTTGIGLRAAFFHFSPD